MARQRAQHVIVLMLENRSFDHMLGFLDHPDTSRFPPLEEHRIPYDLANPTDTVGVNDEASPRLEIDPPHGHASALTQLNANATGGFHMNGFVAAYAQKIAGKEPVPKIHWLKIAGVLLLLAPLFAAAAHNVARLGFVGGWGIFLFPWFVATLAIVAVGAKVLRLDDLPGMRWHRLLVGVLVAAFLCAQDAEGMRRWIDESRGVIPWTLVSAVFAEAALLYAWRRSRERASIPLDRVRRESARIMSCMKPLHVPALAKLAREFAVCTRWYSSVPGATWPNRNFAHAATSEESVDIEVGFYERQTVFEALDAEPRTQDEKRPTWRVYHHDTPQVAAFRNLWMQTRDRLVDAAQLLVDIGKGRLPMYSFVEPWHSGPKSNSQHPGNNQELASEDFARGEKLIAAIYNALVGNRELFAKTVFVVTYDEHGGFYDHIEPPAALHPDPPGSSRRRRELARRIVGIFVEHRNRPFKFTHFGPRVPAVVVSPWVYGEVGGKVDDTVYDHSSIVASVRRLWAPSTKRLTRRDEHANDFLHLLVEHDAPMTPTKIEGFDDAAGAVGLEVRYVELDAAARATDGPKGRARTGGDFADQIETLEFLMLPELRARISEEDIARASAGGVDTTIPAIDDEDWIASGAGYGADVAAAEPDDPNAARRAQAARRPVATALLFKALTDSTWNGNPEFDDL